MCKRFKENSKKRKEEEDVMKTALMNYVQSRKEGVEKELKIMKDLEIANENMMERSIIIQEMYDICYKRNRRSIE